MNLLNTLTIAADEEQLRLRPLPVHAAATQEEHLRRHYALLLAAVLTSQPAVSEPQTRLLRLLLDALKLGDIRGPLFEQARELTPEPLIEAARLIREAGFAHHLVLDVLVLLRLDAPLGNEATRLAGELAAFLGLDEAELATRARDAFDILGLNTKMEKADHSDAGKGTDSNGVEDAAEYPVLLAELWPGRLSQPLTTEALRNGLQGGLWLLETNLDVNFPWQANDAILVFRNGTTLNTFAKEGEIKLTGCRLVDAALDFFGRALRITLERCDWQGDYDPTTMRTALNSRGQSLIVTDCQFSTRNARTLAVFNAFLVVTRCSFAKCGHSKLNGGAVFLYRPEEKSDFAIYFNIKSRSNLQVDDSKFIDCIASLGGALYSDKIRGDFKISGSEFVACKSLNMTDRGKDIAIFSNDTEQSDVVLNSSFHQASIHLGYANNSFAGDGWVFVKGCHFSSGSIYYFDINSKHRVQSGCSFDGGGKIEEIR